MDNADLEHLYDAVVVQETYPKDVCLSEESLVRCLTGEFSETEKGLAAAHLAECEACRRSVEELRRADAWLRDNGPGVFAGMLEKAKVRGLAPWATRPSTQEIECYLERRVPDTDAGRRFSRQLEAKIAASSTLRDTLEQVRSRLADRISVAWTDLRRRSAQAVDVMKQICSGVQSVANAQGIAQVVRAMPGYRAQPAPSVEAALLDERGNLTLDDDGRTRKVRFSIFRAQIERDGHFIIDMATAEDDFWEKEERRFVVTVCLEHEGRRVVLPTEKIYPDGRVTVVGNLVPGMDIRQVPPAVMVVTVTPARNGEEEEPSE